MIIKKLKVDPNQETKIKRAIRKQKGCIIKVCQSDNPGSEGGEFLLTPKQLRKIERSPPGSSVKIMFTADQIKKNLGHSSGFLPLLAAVLAPVISGAIGGVIEREISGKGLDAVIWSKKSGTYQLKPDGNGLRLAPFRGEKPMGYGLYLSPYPHKNGGAVKVDPHDLNDFSSNSKNIIKSIL